MKWGELSREEEEIILTKPLYTKEIRTFTKVLARFTKMVRPFQAKRSPITYLLRRFFIGPSPLPTQIHSATTKAQTEHINPPIRCE